MPDSDALIAAARAARAHAVAPYSSFRVGAALQASDGRIVAGCNIENATLGLTVCAERVALFKAISDGLREFVAMAVVADASPPASPCGACRQLIWEFCGDIPILLADLDRVVTQRRSAELLPLPFENRTFRP